MSEKPELPRTALFDNHRAAGAKIVEFGGWEMPVRYTSILAEHRKVREAAGVFDLSHMGRIYVRGPEALAFVNRVATNDASSLAVGQVQYTLLCNEQGGVVDDILVSRLGEAELLLVVNASNRGKVLDWFDKRLAAELAGLRAGIEIEDRTRETVMIGVQGPEAAAVVQPLVELPLNQLKYYRAGPALCDGAEVLVSRTGYTGEDGFELILPVEAGIRVWERLASQAEAGGIALAGLGARDTLRMEAGMPLYGHEITEDVNPLEAGLGRFVRLDKGEFVGRAALEKVAEAGPARRLIGMELPDRAIARQGSPLKVEDREVGFVTSGSYSPTLDRSIAMALVGSEAAEAGSALSVLVRNSLHAVLVVEIPFFRRRKKK